MFRDGPKRLECLSCSLGRQLTLSPPVCLFARSTFLLFWGGGGCVVFGRKHDDDDLRHVETMIE